MPMYRYRVPGHRIQVRLFSKEDEVGLSDELKKLGFQVAAEKGMEKREKIAAEMGVVEAIGPTAWKHPDYGYGLPDWEPWCKVGDTIMFAKYAGKLYKLPGSDEEIFLINDGDVQLVIEEM